MIYYKANAKNVGEYIKNMHTKLATFFSADSLRMALFPQGEIPHEDPTPVETEGTGTIVSKISALFANPQDDPNQPDIICAHARSPTQDFP